MRARRGGPAPLLLFEADRAAAEAETQRLAAELVQHDRMRVHEADLSPPDMAGQSCWAIETVMGGRWGDDGPTRIFDPTCGAGIFPAAARTQWPGAEIVGCEARVEEEPHVAHNCDRYHIGDVFKAPSELLPELVDLVITNPPFSLIVELLPYCLTLVRPGGLVAFVCRLTWGDKPEADQLWRPPFALTSVMEFAGRWRFRVGVNPKTGKPYGVDSVGYRLLIWRRDERQPAERVLSIPSHRLDLLPAACRRWRKTTGGLWVKPGTEYLHDDLEPLPAVPWRTAA